MTDDRDRRLREVFQAVFELEPGADLASVRQGQTEAWDSLGHVALVTALESEFEVEIGVEDSIEITSFEAAGWILDDLMGGAE